MSKRGQIVIFLIMGVIIVGAAGLTFYLVKDSTDKSTKDQIEQTQDISLLGGSVVEYVNSCLKQVGIEGGVFISEHGGYYELPLNRDQDIAAPYYMNQSVKSIITKDELERQLALYVEDQLFFCLKNFASFPALNIQQENTQAMVHVSSDTINIEVTLPLTIEQDVFVKSYSSFATKIPSSLGTLHDASTTFIDAEEQDSLCISCITTLATDHGFRAVVSPVENNVILFSLIDEQSGLEYNFLSEYRFGGQE